MSAPVSVAPKKGAARCPRFDGCNAPICPLDDWQRAQHLQGEPVCSLLCELVKDGGEARLRARVSSDLVDTLAEVLPKVAERWGRVRMQLQRASRTGSRMEAGERLQPRTRARAAGNHPTLATRAPGEPCKSVTLACVGPSIGCEDTRP